MTSQAEKAAKAQRERQADLADNLYMKGRWSADKAAKYWAKDK